MNRLSYWSSLPLAVLVVFTAPILIVILSLFGGFSENWFHIFDYLIFDYVKSSLILVLGVTSIVLAVGTVTAWIVTTYNFPGKGYSNGP